MSDQASETWTDANQQYLVAALATVEWALARHAGQPVDANTPDTSPQRLADMAATMLAPPALDTLCQLFGLSCFERDILLLCAGVELETAYAALCAAAQGDPRRDYPTFSLALAALPGAHWSALSPEAPLRRWELVHLEPGRALTRSPLRIDERILHTLVGIPHLDERLEGLVRPLVAEEGLAPCQEELVREITAAWVHAAGEGSLPVVQLCGPQEASRQAVAAHVCARLGLDPYLMPAAVLPPQPGEVARLRRAWEREAILGERALLLETDDLDRQDAARESALAHWLACGFGPLFFSGCQRRASRGRGLLTYDVPKPSTGEQRGLWEATLGGEAARLDGHLERLVAQFDLEGPAIRSAWAKAQGRLAAAGHDAKPAVEALGQALWDVCRVQARPQLDDLAQRIEPAAAWDDLVLPEAQRQTLREIAIHVRQRTQVYERWDFYSKGRRGLGISALFAGLSGTGKTMAAEALARELRLDLYRIDLSAVVSKYIGETEKNLRQVFNAAEGSGAILLFDEADALFGKRSEVKDSHDRYANIEVSYLLQRMEAYRGLAILTTNRKDALDDAFTRRIRFVVQFPFPDAAQRAEIWRRIFPAATPTEGLDMERLARLNVPGGNIRNIALHAAFLAADAGEPVRMPHLLSATRREYDKLERALTESEIRGWDGGEG
jgi:hypothetical protein